MQFSQLECSMLYLLPLFLDYQANGHIMNRLGNRSPGAAPHGVYRCKGDDRWCAIAVTTETQWRNMCELIGNTLLSEEKKFGRLSARKENEDELDGYVEKWTENRSLKSDVSTAIGWYSRRSCRKC
jgi:crotonobetainyl-CoA:carnitine CoA-transferase CaiB-like acyl-CoA transferase